MGGEGWCGEVVSKTRGWPAGPESWPGSDSGSLFMYSFFFLYLFYFLFFLFVFFLSCTFYDVNYMYGLYRDVRPQW